MALTQSSAFSKDTRTAQYGVKLQHRHFSFIAAVLKETMPTACSPDLWMQHIKMVDAFTDACARSNPRFDRVRFRKACGVVS